MKLWPAIVGLYLVTAPFPALVAHEARLDLPYEEIGFWIVALYSAPLWLVSENVNGGSVLTHSLIYWLILLFGFLIWKLVRHKPVEKAE